MSHFEASPIKYIILNYLSNLSRVLHALRLVETGSRKLLYRGFSLVELLSNLWRHSLTTKTSGGDVSWKFIGSQIEIWSAIGCPNIIWVGERSHWSTEIVFDCLFGLIQASRDRVWDMEWDKWGGEDGTFPLGHSMRPREPANITRNF